MESESAASSPPNADLRVMRQLMQTLMHD